MPEIFKNEWGRLVNIDGRQVTTELSILMATAMALGAHSSDIDQEIHCDIPGGPLWTRTSVTIDFSTKWRVEGSPWAPPSGMPIHEAVGLLVEGIRPFSVLDPPITESPITSRSPSPVGRGVITRDSHRSPSPFYENPSGPPSSRSVSPVLRADTEHLEDEVICEACLTWQIMRARVSVECVCEAPEDTEDTAFMH
ncbi:hypothetical protein FIBSPDRAFT_957461 [Athelia psychrophila]|uniref:Uncharacterized protein n=1 Tax=Athelia psychrophila TaxID=1759441 RepID=A0A166FSW0_9AGAM|nr:hypothetical protein FIBSPDRAFT_957461 [Fibularhizoctonia sp. CBS 109695]